MTPCYKEKDQTPQCLGGDHVLVTPQNMPGVTTTHCYMHILLSGALSHYPSRI